MKYQEFLIKQPYKSIYYFLKDEGFSENYITNLRKTWGNFVVNDKIVNIRERLLPNDNLKINSNPNNKTTIMQCILPLNIVYEDKYYLLVNKPSALSCMPSRSHYNNNLAGAICNYMKDKDDNFVLRIINRLDKDTAGIIIVAKDSISANKLKEVNKIYHAICIGEINQNLTINKKIKTINFNGKNEHKRIISEEGQEAVTHIHPISSTKDYSLLSIKLEHGRTHQIRLHLSHINHHLLGDTLYGEKSELIDHAALICKKVSFYHPYLNQYLNFNIDYPNDFNLALKKLNIKKEETL